MKEQPYASDAAMAIISELAIGIFLMHLHLNKKIACFGDGNYESDEIWVANDIRQEQRKKLEED